MEATTDQASAEQPTESELQRRLAEVEIAIAAGDGDLFALDDEKTELMRMLHVARLAREQREGREYRARNAKTLSDFMKRVDSNTKEVNRHVIALVSWLTDTRKLVAESNNIPFDGSVKTTEEVFGFPPDFPDKIIAAIREAAPRTQWDFSTTEPPKLRGPLEVRVPRFADDMAAPPGFVGAWDRLRGRPFEEPTGDNVLFLPPVTP